MAKWSPKPEVQLASCWWPRTSLLSVQPVRGRAPGLTVVPGVSTGEFLHSGTKPNQLRRASLIPLSAPGKGGGYLSVICLLSSQPRLQPIPFSVEWVQDSARGDWLHQEMWWTRQDGGSWLRCQPGQSKRSRNSWPVVSVSPSSLLAGPTPSFANSVQC